MRCPRCESAELHEFDRDGITVGRCNRCRGVWLDRGELEKLLTLAQAEVETTGSGPRPTTAAPAWEHGSRPAPPGDDRYRGDRHGDDRYRDRRHRDDDDDDDDRYRSHPRKRGFFHTLRELVD